jgi:hypothetical protein
MIGYLCRAPDHSIRVGSSRSDRHGHGDSESSGRCHESPILSSGILYTWPGYMSVRHLVPVRTVPTCTDLYDDIVCTGTYYLRNLNVT